MKKFIVIIGLSLFFSANVATAQCPMCKTALKSNKNGGKSTVGNGINQGILFLMTMPYLLVGTAGLVWYNVNRKKKNG